MGPKMDGLYCLYWKIRLNNMDNLELPPIWDIFQEISTCTLTQVSHLPGLPRLHRLCQILREVPGDRRSQSIFDATCAIHGLIVLNFIYYIYVHIYRDMYIIVYYIYYTQNYTHTWLVLEVPHLPLDIAAA